MGLIDNNLDVVVSYTYDSWGNIVSITGSMSATLGNDNPFRYRGYYYDSETGLYYLNSRYYDAQTCRFINADGYVSTGQGILGNNMFAYCGNNPVNRADPTGEVWWIIPIIVPFVFVFTGCSSKSEPYSNQANCYAYAMKLENDPRTGKPFTSKPQPGEFSGRGITYSDLTKEPSTVKSTILTKVNNDASKLGLTFTEVSSADHIPKQGNWLVALAIDTNVKNPDYHWWRQDGDGTWSHKPGSTPILYWDLSKNVITDPATCNRGRYNYFCGYYEVGPK